MSQNSSETKCSCGSTKFVPIGCTTGEDKNLVVFGRKRIESSDLQVCLNCGRVYVTEGCLRWLQTEHYEYYHETDQ